MAEVTIQFNDETDNKTLKRISKSLDMANAIFDIDINLRKRLKHKLENVHYSVTEDIIDVVFDEIHAVLEENRVFIDDLVD